MRKMLVLLAAVFSLAVGVGSMLPQANAAFTPCHYKCICSVPNKCCTVNGVETCKPDPDGPIQCTQSYPC
jgi:hypothetical protein